MNEASYGYMIRNVSEYAQRVGSRRAILLDYNPDGTFKKPQDKVQMAEKGNGRSDAK